MAQVPENLAEPILKVCLFCGKIAEKMNKCKICVDKLSAKSYYCSKACQENHWPTHKTWHRQQDARLSIKSIEKVREQISNSSIKTRIRPAAHGMTLLMYKSYIGDLAGVEKMLNEGADTLEVDDQGLTAIQYAVFADHFKIFELLVTRGPRELLFKVPPAIEGQTCLHDLCAKGLLEYVELLIRVGGKKLLLTSSVKEGATCLYPACQQNHLPVVKALLRHGGDELLHKAAKDGSTCLFIASAIGHLEIVRLLAAAGGDRLVFATQPDGYSCLKIACYAGHAAVAEALLDAGGDRLLHMATANGLGPFHVACQHGHLPVVRALLARAGPAALLASAPFALHAACAAGQAPVVRALLAAAGAAALGADGPADYSPLDAAAQHGQADAVPRPCLLGGQQAHTAPASCAANTQTHTRARGRPRGGVAPVRVSGPAQSVTGPARNRPARWERLWGKGWGEWGATWW